MKQFMAFNPQYGMVASIAPTPAMALTPQEQSIASGVSGVFGALGWLFNAALLAGGVFAIHKGHKWVGSGLAYAGTVGLVHKVVDQTGAGATPSTTADLVISGGALLSTIGLNKAFAPKSASHTHGYRRRRK